MSPRLPCRALLLALLLATPLAAQSRGPFDRAEKLMRQGKFSAAQEILAPYVAAHPNDARAAYGLGRAYLEMKERDDAVKWLRRAVELDDGNSDYHLWLGNAYGVQAMHASIFRQPGLARRTHSEFERAVELDPDNLGARSGLIQFYLMAPGILGGSKEKAREQAEEIGKRNPYLGGFALASVEADAKNPAAVAAAYEALIRQYPDSTAPLIQRVMLYENDQAYDEAAKLLDSFLARHPGSMPVLYQVGRLGAVSGERLDAAEAALRRYLHYTPPAGEPSIAGAHWRLGMIAERRGNPDGARAEYLTALQLDPKLKEAEESLKKMGD